ncbi:hypothetical protein PMI07_003938 [Rhizobium sp. CF080]|uniref:hypothetical protein n=1 Tax=Rhizobium sp. (strain CF080) TaxID=1144310 RepID=UPI000271BD4B|nr:hypothetical protein [Rhizobium sp. CF080]EUC00652.1 hypothetical protein PMI07_003938 [Rhizobium sp. CF080]
MSCNWQRVIREYTPGLRLLALDVLAPLSFSDMSEPDIRYDIRKYGEFTWEIFDTTTGRTVIVEGKAYSDLPQDSADILAAFMNSVGIVPDKETLQ